MDFVSNYQKKLASFRLKEIKDILTRLGVAKQGKKQELMDRIIALLSSEASDVRGLTKKSFTSKEVANIIDDAYRKLQAAGATSSIDGKGSLQVNKMKLKEVEDPARLYDRIHCPCGSSFPTENMIQCADLSCRVLQHANCVIIPEGLEAVPLIPSPFYCEICRINRADPFRVTVAQLLSPVKLITSNAATDGTNPMQFVERAFPLGRADRDLLKSADYDVQAWCILLNDKVSFRMQWPLYSDLKVNGEPVRTVNRPGSQLLGANGRDDGPIISLYLGDGCNQISLSGCDARSFCLGVRLVKQRTVQQIIDLILEEQNCESFEDALSRVRRCVGSGMAMADEDSDSDLEVITDCITVTLRCPMSGSRIKTAGRFRACTHMGCFDVETFVQLNQRSRKWQCPICLKNYSLEDITIDHYFNRISKMMQDCEEDITDIEVMPDGSWRVKNGCQFSNLGHWHLPDGSACLSTIESVPNLDASVQLEEDGTVGHINRDEVSKYWDLQITSRNRIGEFFDNNIEIVNMGRFPSESHRDNGGYSNYQDDIRNTDISANDGHEISALPYNSLETARAIYENASASFGDLDVIVLSDSEEENANLTSRETFSMTQGVDGADSFSGPPGISNVYIDDPVISSGMDYGNDFEISHQAFASCDQDCPPCRQFYTDNAPDTLVDSEYISVTSSAPVDGEALNSKRSIDLGGQSDLGNNHKTSSGIYGGNLTSGLVTNIGGGGNRSAAFHAKPATSNGPDLVNQFGLNEVSISPHMHDEIGSAGTANGKRSGPFSFPRRPRSTRRPFL